MSGFIKGDKGNRGMGTGLDLLLINPSERKQIYQELAAELASVEPPLWCRLIAGYVRDRGYSVEIIDAEADDVGIDTVAEMVAARAPRLVAMVVFGHQPSASTQQMAAATPTCLAIKALNPEQRIIIVGGHPAALPERTLREAATDFVCNSEGPITVQELLDVLRAGEPHDFGKVQGLVWWDNGQVRNNVSPALIKDLDKDLHGNVWDLLPMQKYRAHNWQCFADLEARQPYASIYTSLGCPYKLNVRSAASTRRSAPIATACARPRRWPPRSTTCTTPMASKPTRSSTKCSCSTSGTFWHSATN
jgi:hypothetical protein